MNEERFDKLFALTDKLTDMARDLLDIAYRKFMTEMLYAKIDESREDEKAVESLRDEPLEDEKE